MARWNGFRSILCPIDFSEQSRLALRYAEAMALRGNAGLRVMYVNDPLLVASARTALHDKGFVKRSDDHLAAFVDETLAAGWRKRLRVLSQVTVGMASDEILKAAARGKADLIVLGTTGLTAANRLLLGSTSLSVLQRTTVPVLAVPTPNGAPPARLKSWPGRQVVAPVEFDGDAAKEVDTAARLAEWFGSSLLLVHVVDAVAAPAWIRGNLNTHDRIRIAQAQDQLDRFATSARRRVKTDARVICGRVSDEIAALAATERTGLLMTALRERVRWFGAKRGSVSYHVLALAATPVLAFPPGWRP